MAGVHEWRGQGDASDTRRRKYLPLFGSVCTCLRTELFLVISTWPRLYFPTYSLFSSHSHFVGSPVFAPPPPPFHFPLLALQCAPLLPSSSPSPCLFMPSQLIVPSVVTMALLYALVVTSFRGRLMTMLDALSMTSPLERTHAFPLPTFSLNSFYHSQNCLWR